MRVGMVGAVGLAALLMGVGFIPLDGAWAVVLRTWPVLLFLLVMKFVSDLCDDCGIFRAWAAMMFRWSRGSAWSAFALFSLVSIVCTAVLSLDATVVLMTPIAFTLGRRLRISPAPMVFASVWIANVASLFLPTSNLTNLLAVQTSGWSASRFVWRMLPMQGAVLVVCLAALAWWHRRDLSAGRGAAVSASQGSRNGGCGEAIFDGSAGSTASLGVSGVAESSGLAGSAGREASCGVVVPREEPWLLIVSLVLFVGFGAAIVVGVWPWLAAVVLAVALLAVRWLRSPRGVSRRSESARSSVDMPPQSVLRSETGMTDPAAGAGATDGEGVAGESGDHGVRGVMRLVGRMPWAMSVCMLALFVLFDPLSRMVREAVGPWLYGLPAWAAGGALGVLGALGANAVNNLPAYLMLEPSAMAVGALPMLLVGVNAGPLVAPWGSLANLLWMQICRERGHAVDVGMFVRRGALVVPFMLCVAAVLR